MNVFAQRLGVPQSQIQGEPGTGYEPPKNLGEFECENCEYFDPKTSSCGQGTMKAKSRLPRLENGRVKVHPEGCCEFVKRIGRIEEHEEQEEAGNA